MGNEKQWIERGRTPVPAVRPVSLDHTKVVTAGKTPIAKLRPAPPSNDAGGSKK